MTRPTKQIPAKSDTHLVNLIRRTREELQANRPVLAHMWLADLEKYVMDRGAINVKN